MFYVQLRRPSKVNPFDPEKDFIYYSAFNADANVLESWVRPVEKPGDTVEVWWGTLSDGTVFEPSSDEPFETYVVPHSN